jgi:hypothetical protein
VICSEVCLQETSCTIAGQEADTRLRPRGTGQRNKGVSAKALVCQAHQLRRQTDGPGGSLVCAHVAYVRIHGINVSTEYTIGANNEV